MYASAFRAHQAVQKKKKISICMDETVNNR